MMPEISALLFKDGPFYPWSRICYKPGNCSKEEPSSIKNVLSFVNFCFEYSLNAILERLIIILDVLYRITRVINGRTALNKNYACTKKLYCFTAICRYTRTGTHASRLQFT